MPKISVIIPTYNSAILLPETLQSVLDQDIRDYEIIVVDDGSTDDTEKVLQPFMKRIHYIRQENSGGPARPRNVGIHNARGKYLSFLDSDDVMLRGKLRRGAGFLDEHNGLGMVFTNFVKQDESGNQYPGTHLDASEYFQSMSKIRVGEDAFVIPHQVAYHGLFRENFIGTSGVMTPRPVIDQVGLFDETVTRGGVEDRDMWFRITQSYDIGYLNVVGHIYRRRNSSLSRQALEPLQARISVIRKHMESCECANTRAAARRLIARCLYSMGYVHQNAGRMKIARKYYWLSLREVVNRAALRGMVITFLGNKVIRGLRYARDHWNADYRVGGIHR